MIEQIIINTVIANRNSKNFSLVIPLIPKLWARGGARLLSLLNSNFKSGKAGRLKESYIRATDTELFDRKSGYAHFS